MRTVTRYLAAAVGLAVLPSLACAAATSSVPLPDETAGPLVLALEADYPPFLFAEGGAAKGIAYDYAVLVAEKMGRPLSVTAPMQLQKMLDAVASGEANLLADVTATPERDAYLEFSAPYVETPAVVVGRKGEPAAWGRAAAPSVAVGKGYGVVSFLRREFPEARLIELPSDVDVLRAVALGASDFGVLDTGSLSYLLQKEPLSNVEVVAETGFSYALSFAVAEADAATVPAIDAAAAKITQEERAGIYSRWLSTVPKRVERPFSPEVVGWIGGFALFGILAAAWAFSLRRTVGSKTEALVALNRNLDGLVGEKVAEVTKLKDDAERRSEELGRLNRSLIDRELKMVELKERIKELESSGSGRA